MVPINVLIIGNGGREHALARGLNESSMVENIHIAPGNIGTAKIGTNHDIDISKSKNIIKLATKLNIDLAVIGPENPLVDGVADDLKIINIPCFGPVSKLARLEGSKKYAKELMKSLGVPTADYAVITKIAKNHETLDIFNPPWVIKRDVLAGGKGVTVTTDKKVASSVINDAIETDGYVLVEKFLEGEEASILVMMDESDYVCLPPSQDHKRLLDGDKGPNTGGMGAYAPAPMVSPSILQRVENEIIIPMHHFLRNQKIPYRGCLYVGIMIDSNGAPSVVEFNVRFGDPETQVTIPLVSSDVGEMLYSVASGNLSKIDVNFHNLHSATVVLASENYPYNPVIGRLLSGDDVAIEEGEITAFINYAGASQNKQGNCVSSGGRVLSATGVAPSLKDAVEASYQIMNNISLKGSQFRSDIAFKAFRR